MESPRVRIRLKDELGDFLRERTAGADEAQDSDLCASAERLLERHRVALREELACVRFSQSEALIVCEALKGRVLDEGTIRLLYAEVETEAERRKLDLEYDVKGPMFAELIARLKGLTYTQRQAVVDAVERYWIDGEQNLRQTGLIGEAPRVLAT